MFCYHCGKLINEHKIESKKPTLNMVEEVNDSDVTVQYICPRCGHLIHENASEDNIKELSRAAHSEIQRGNNFFASGMGSNSIGIILLAIGIIFFLLAHKPANGHQLDAGCPEFFVSLVLIVVSVVLLTVGITFTIIGLVRKIRYGRLLVDINNGTFVQ